MWAQQSTASWRRGSSGLGIRLLFPWPRAVSGTNQGFSHQQLAGAHCHLLDIEAAVSGVPRKSYLRWDTETQAWDTSPGSCSPPQEEGGQLPSGHRWGGACPVGAAWVGP